MASLSENINALAARIATSVKAINTKLNGIEAGAQVNPTALDILAALLGVDGTGSGLDADTLRNKVPGSIGLNVLGYSDLAALKVYLGGTDYYTGTSSENTSFPVGQYLMVTQPTTVPNIARNAAVTPRLGGSGGTSFTIENNGRPVLSGTWRAKGLSGSQSGDQAWNYLVVRVS